MSNNTITSSGDGTFSRAEHFVQNIGYVLADSHNAVLAAMRNARNILDQSIELGTQTRAWAVKALEKANEYLAIFESLIKVQRSGFLQPADTLKLAREVLLWEGTVRQVLERYMTGTSESHKDLRKLNPPLENEALKPLVEEFLLDRQLTIACLEPLIKAMGEIEKTRQLASV